MNTKLAPITLRATILTSFALLSLTASQVLAQNQEQSWMAQCPGCGGYNSQGGMWDSTQGRHYHGMYNPKTVETLRGQVVNVNTFSPWSGMSGVQVLVKTGNQTIPVQLGPSWYIDQQGFQIQAGDEIQVTGSRVNFSGGPAIMATEIRHGKQVLTLRNSNGIPAWSGWNQPGGGWGPCCGW
jgi:hypothetical protein